MSTLEERLNLVHPHVASRRQVWAEISELIDPELVRANSHRYIPKRPGEQPDLYNLRRSRFTYTPVLATAVRDLVKKLKTGQLRIESEFTPLTDSLANFNSVGFLSELMRLCVLYGECWVLITSNEFGEPEPVALPPTSVLNYNLTGDNPWAVVKSLDYESPEEPGEVLLVERWVVITPTAVKTYTKPVDNSRPLTLTQETSLTYRALPVLRFTVPVELWTAVSCITKQRQHVYVENSLTDSASNLYIQRVRSNPPVADSDLGETYVNQVTHAVVTSNAHVVEGDFSFVEASGSSVTTNMALLTQIEEQIRGLVSLLQNNGVGRDTSGESKKYDYSNLADTLTSYGVVLVHAYQHILERMALVGWGQTVEVAVNGLDSFELSTLGALLEQSVLLQQLPPLPPTALRLWYSKLAGALVGTTGQEEKAALEREFSSWTATPLVKPTFN